SYSVNGVRVSDFYTPQYFDPVAAAGVRYSFGGSLTAPRQIREGGYLSWRVPETNEWWAGGVLDGELVFFRVEPPGRAMSLREFIDAVDRRPSAGQRRALALPSTSSTRAEVRRASERHAELVNDAIGRLVGSKTPLRREPRRRRSSSTRR